MTPRASIVIAMHNAATTVGRALESLQAQSEPHWEAIVVDDGSTDASASIVEKYAAVDTRVRLVQQPNAGAGAARNTGLDRCRGDFVGFLDADDWLEPAALEVLLAACGQTGAACGACLHCDQDGRPLAWNQSCARRAEVGLNELLTREAFAIHSQLIRRDLAGETRFRTHLDCFEDLDFFLRLAEQGVRWRTVERVVGTYRQRPRTRGTPQDAARFQTIASVYVDSFTRMRVRSPGNAPTTDVSPDALNRLLFGRAVTYATMMILQDQTPAKDRAASVLASLGPGLQMSPEDAAHAAHGYLPWSELRAIADWPRHIERYAQALGAWWSRCIEDRRAAPDLIERAIPLLARRIANELDIPGALIKRLDTTRPITILGGGRNGVRLAEALAARGLRFSVRDDRPDGCNEVVNASRGLARIEDPGEAPHSRSQYIMSLLDDAGYLRSLPSTLRSLRWAEVVDEEARVLALHLASALHQPC